VAPAPIRRSSCNERPYSNHNGLGMLSCSARSLTDGRGVLLTRKRLGAEKEGLGISTAIVSGALTERLVTLEGLVASSRDPSARPRICWCFGNSDGTVGCTP